MEYPDITIRDIKPVGIEVGSLLRIGILISIIRAPDREALVQSSLHMGISSLYSYLAIVRSLSVSSTKATPSLLLDIPENETSEDKLEGVDEDTMFKIMEGFGLGMGCMQGTCGAVSGAQALIGMRKSKGCADPTSKAATYQVAKEVMRKFAGKNGSVVCKELKGVETGKMLRSCDGCIQDAARIVEEILED